MLFNSPPEQQRAKHEAAMLADVRKAATATDAQLAEDTLLASDQNYRLLVETIPHMVWMTDGEGRTNYLNHRAEIRLAVHAKALFDWNWLDLVHPDDRDQARKLWESSINSGSEYRHEYRLWVAEGKYRWYLAKGMPLHGKTGDIDRWIGTWTDIDYMKTSEAGHKKTSALLKAVADNTTDAIFVKDRQGRYMLFNPAAARFVGLSIENVLGLDDTALFNGKDARRVMERDRRIMESGEAETQEECLTAAGVTRTYLATKAPYRNAEGNVIGLIGISHDLTERKRAEEALKSSEERFRAFMDNSPAGAWISDLQGHCLYASGSYARTVGIAPKTLIGRKFSDFFPADHAELYLRNSQSVAETGTVLETIEPGIRADGTLGEFLVYKFPLSDAEGATIVGGVAVDVTERRKMEETLRLRDRAIGAATQGILIIDAIQHDNPIIYVSPGFERLTGYSSEECLGKNYRFLEGPDTDCEAKARLREALDAGMTCTVELVSYRKDGSPFWNQLSISPVRDAEGRLTHFVGVQNDITLRRQLEQQIQQSQKMEAIGQLAGGVAHDFNNLLTIINGYSAALLGTMSPDHPFWEPLDEIHKAGERSANLTRQLLAFSRRQVFALESLDLNAIVTNAEKMLRRLIGENIELITNLSAAPLPVRADAGQIEQILLNLVVNARDAMPDGGKVTIETEGIDLSSDYCDTHPDAQVGRYAKLAVSDTGSGMSADVLSRVFEPFFTTKSEGRGTGLGLAVVHGIVEQSGGHLEISSEGGSGTTFKILLPHDSGNLQQKANVCEVTSETLPQGRETILLVEDEPGVRGFAKQVLESCGYTVLAASDGADATRILNSLEEGLTFPIHLLVTDVVMPQESGPQIAERMQKDHPDIEVIFLSGYTEDAMLRHGIRNNEVNFLQKPFTAVELAKKVRMVLTKVSTPEDQNPDKGDSE